MVEHEQPSTGGSFIRQKDGSLVPNSGAAQPAQEAPAADSDDKAGSGSRKNKRS